MQKHIILLVLLRGMLAILLWAFSILGAFFCFGMLKECYKLGAAFDSDLSRLAVFAVVTASWFFVLRLGRKPRESAPTNAA